MRLTVATVVVAGLLTTGFTCTVSGPGGFSPVVGIASLSPAHEPTPSTSDWSSYWLQMRGQGGSQGINVPWDDSGAGVIPAAIPYVTQAGFAPVMVLGVTSAMGDSGKMASLEAMLTTLVKQYSPVYLGLGNEIDEESSFDDVAAFVNQLADYVHSLGKPTAVFTVFQYEHMLGLPDAADRIAAVASVDFVAFTTYPFLRYSTGDAVPSDYYDPIATWTNLPIAFSEVGWPSRADNGPAYPNVRGSEQDQLDLIQTFRAAVTGYPTLFANWFALHDSAAWVEGAPVATFEDVVQSAGLMANDSNDSKAALASWLNRSAPEPE